MSITITIANFPKPINVESPKDVLDFITHILQDEVELDPIESYDIGVGLEGRTHISMWVFEGENKKKYFSRIRSEANTGLIEEMTISFA